MPRGQTEPKVRVWPSSGTKVTAVSACQAARLDPMSWPKRQTYQLKVVSSLDHESRVFTFARWWSRYSVPVLWEGKECQLAWSPQILHFHPSARSTIRTGLSTLLAWNRKISKFTLSNDLKSYKGLRKGGAELDEVIQNRSELLVAPIDGGSFRKEQRSVLGHARLRCE